MVTEKKGSTKKASTKKSTTTQKTTSVAKKGNENATATKKKAAAQSTSPAKKSVKKATTGTVARKSNEKKSVEKKTGKTATKKTAAKSATMKKTTSGGSVKSNARAPNAQEKAGNQSTPKKDQQKETQKVASKEKSSSTLASKGAQSEHKSPTKQASKAVKQEASVTLLDPYAEEIREQNTSQVLSQALVRGKFKPYIMKLDEEYMNLVQREHFKNILNDWRAELMQEVDRTVHHMKDESANLPDPADRATQEEEFNLELRTRDRERKLIKKIDKTLERIEHDDYGFCDKCGVDIGLRRLEARPTANLCIDCKTLEEIKERQFRS